MQNKQHSQPIQANLYKQVDSSDEEASETQLMLQNKPDLHPQNSQQDEQHFREYMSYFEDIEHERQTDKTGFREVHWSLGNFCPILTILDVKHSKSYEIVVIEAKLGAFYTQFRILNTKQKNPFHSCQLAGFGAFGDVYTIQTNRQKHKSYEKYAIKCFPINSEAKQHSHLRSILKQLFILKLTNETLQNQNEKSQNLAYFDLIHYDSCVEFSMDRLGWNEDTDNMQLDLKRCLRSFHKLGLVHCDIKEENIAYNKQNKRWVFIDFGLSLIVQQTYNQKTQTTFLGNFKNASPQMRKISRNPKGGQINLYYNDYYGLKSMLKAFYKGKENLEDRRFHQFVNESNIQKVQDFLFIMKLKYFLYGLSIDNESIDSLFAQFKQKNDSNIRKVVIDFMSETKLAVLCRPFYDELLKHRQISTEYSFYKISHAHGRMMFQNDEEVPQFQVRLNKLLQNHSTNLSLLFIESNVEATLLDEAKVEEIDRQLYFSNILDYISFTKNKFQKTLQEKHIVCHIFNKVILKKTHQLPHQALSSTVLHLLDYCTTLPFTRWKRQHLHQVLTQYYILGLGQNAKILELISFFKQTSKSLAQLAFTLYLLYESFVWDHNILIKPDAHKIDYYNVVKKLTEVITQLQKISKQRNLNEYLLQRVSDIKPFQYKDSLQTDYFVIVYFIVDLGIRQKYKVSQTQMMKVLTKLKKLSSRDSFVSVYGRGLYKMLLNLGIKLTYLSSLQSSAHFIDILLNLDQTEEFSYYYFNIINSLRKMKENSSVLNLMRKLKQSINASELWQNSVTSYMLIEQTSQEVLENKYTTRIIQKSMQTLARWQQDDVRVVLNLWKCIQIFAVIALKMAEKQYIFINKYCRQNYHSFLKCRPTVITVPNMLNHIQLAYAQSRRYFTHFQKALDWMTIKYVYFLSRNLVLAIYIFGKYFDVPFIMRGNNLFCLFLRAAQLNPQDPEHIQNRHRFFLDFLCQKTKKTDSIASIIDSYQQQKNLTLLQICKPNQRIKVKHYTNSQFMVIFYNIDCLLAEQIRNLAGIDQSIYRNYLLQIILNISISMLIMFRKYDTVGNGFPLQHLQKFFMKKFFHVHLQHDNFFAYKKQILMIYVEYLGNLHQTFVFLLQEVKKEGIAIQDYQNHFQALFTTKIISLKRILAQTNSYCLIRYFNVFNTTDVFVFKVLLKHILSIPEKQQLKAEIIELFEIMSVVYDNKESWRHFFILKELLQFTTSFTAETLMVVVSLLLQVKWKSTADNYTFKNYRLLKFFNYLFCSLIDCFLTNAVNNMRQLLNIPMLNLTTFRCHLADHPCIINLMKIQEVIVQKMSLRVQIQVLPYLLMIAIYKANEIDSYSPRFYLYLQKKMIKGLVVNDWGNMFITYCQQYLSLVRKTHISYFKAIFARLKCFNPKNKKLLKPKVQKYYCLQSKET